MVPLRILVVDDHEAIRRGLRALLSSRADWSVCGEACNGLEAVDKAKNLRPDVILMDVSMPVMDGLAATSILHVELPESEVIIVSQNNREIIGRQAREAGASRFVAKDDIVQKLVPTLNELALHKRRASPE